MAEAAPTSRPDPNDMARRGSAWLVRAWVVVAVIALFSLWGHNISYWGETSSNPLVAYWELNYRFWADSFANPATTSLTLDILLLGLGAILWMLTEARRLQLSYVWAYIVLAVLIGISVTFPLFLAVREARIAKAPDAEVGTMSRIHARGWEAAVVVAQLALMLYIVGFSYTR